MTSLFRAFLLTAWISCAGTTFYAAVTHGFQEMMPYFLQGYTHPWGTAINVDFTLCLLTASIWLAWSAKSPERGLVYGLLAFALGGTFLFAYVLIQSFATKGDMRTLILGRQSRVQHANASEPAPITAPL
jgi:hypothetical protein